MGAPSELLLALLVIFAAAKSVGEFTERIGLPAVLREMVGAIDVLDVAGSASVLASSSGRRHAERT